MKTPWGKRNTQKWNLLLSDLLDIVYEFEQRDIRIQFTNTLKYGECWLENDIFHINLGSKQCFSDAVHTLIHELAHVIAWDYNEFSEHSPQWGIIYAYLYRSWEKMA